MPSRSARSPRRRWPIPPRSAKQTTDYDSQGRIVATEDEMRTFETTYDYSVGPGLRTTSGSMGPDRVHRHLRRLDRDPEAGRSY